MTDFKDYLVELFSVVLVAAIGLVSYVAKRYHERNENALSDLKDSINGSNTVIGLKARLDVVEEKLSNLSNETFEEIEELKQSVDDIRRQIVENQRALTRDLSIHAQKTDRQLGEIIGYLKAKRETDD